MVKKILLAAMTILIMTSLGCGDMLDAQAAKDRDLSKAVHDNLKSHPGFSSNFVAFEYTGDAGEYRIKLKDIPDGQTAGKLGYNAMVVLIERNDTKVQTGRNKYIIHGLMDGEDIFEVSKVVGPGQGIEVTLSGIYAGEVFTPNIGH